MNLRRHLSKVAARIEAPGLHRSSNAVYRTAILLLVIVAFGVAAPSRGNAATRTVCASGCKNTTIVAAIAAAKAGDTISILGAIQTEWNITVDRNLTIQGQGAAKTAVDGAQSGIVFTVNSGVTTTFRNLTIRNGSTNQEGGGILNGGTLTVTTSSFSGNSAAAGGGIENEGNLTVTNSTFSGNTAGDGGAINNVGTVTISNSTFSDNGSITGGAIESVGGTLTVTTSAFSRNNGRQGGGILNNGTLTVTNSSFSGSQGSHEGGGIDNVGGTLTVTNSTFADNIFCFVGCGISNHGTLTVTNSTFAGNGASLGAAAIFGPATVKNSILAGSVGANCSGAITDGGYNISDDATCGFSATGSRNSTNPILDPAGLQNNGGPTKTIALDSESPAIDAIPSTACTDQNSNPIHTDQRGALRPDPGEVVCDIGAYEFQDFAGQAQCEDKSDSALAQQYGGLSAAASAYGFSTVKALETAIQRSCGH
jgi:hypothetical protein